MPRRCSPAFYIPCAFSLALLVAPPALSQHKSPTEAQCKQMTEQMLGVMKSTPAQLEKEKERKDAKALLERAERIVKDGRARGDRECEVWSAVNKLIVHQ